MTINVPPQSSVAAKVTQLGEIYLNKPPIDNNICRHFMRYTFVNTKLRNISNDKITAYSLILKELNSHLSFVIYQQYLSFCTEQLFFHFLFLHLFYLTEEVGSKDKVVEEFIF